MPHRISILGELTAWIAHELKQPLAAIVTNGHAAQRWLEANVRRRRGAPNEHAHRRRCALSGGQLLFGKLPSTRQCRLLNCSMERSCFSVPKSRGAT